MKNIHVLPTEKPSRLFYNVGGALLFTNYENHNGVNIYITSDEPAYPYAFHITNQEVLKVRAVGYKSLELYHDKGFSFSEQCRKIILTTDQDLIADGVQAIDNEFLEWFVKNPSCGDVEIEDISMQYHEEGYYEYKIIIPKEDWLLNNPHCKQIESCSKSLSKKCICPKEEPKQETLEEFIQIQLSLGKYQDQESAIKYSIELGAKWQQKQDKNKYSKEEVLEHLNYLNMMPSSKLDLYTDNDEMITAKWFEQFKKK